MQKNTVDVLETDFLHDDEVEVPFSASQRRLSECIHSETTNSDGTTRELQSRGRRPSPNELNDSVEEICGRACLADLSS